MGVPLLPDNLADILRNLADRLKVLETVRAQPWVAPTLLNGWVYYGAPYSPPGYMFDGSRVYLRGLVKSGTVGSGTPIFTLPAGLRPASTWIVAVPSNDLFGEIRVDSSGNVYVSVGSNSWVSLDGVQFSVVA